MRIEAKKYLHDIGQAAELIMGEMRMPNQAQRHPAVIAANPGELDHDR